ncbi:MAG: Rpn family recombination-promoting nuclease/putative transposase [Saprospiraceae bacterium]
MDISGKYINLFTDFGFKRVFGEEANKDILMDFLNEVLPKEYTIQDLHFSKNEHLGKSIENRKAIFDLFCISDKGEHFIVELQKARQDFFKDRSIYYASFPIQQMAKKGKSDGVDWNYELNPIFTIGILNFVFQDELTKKNELHHHVQLKDQDCQVFYDKLHFIYLELPKFTKTLADCKSHYERWLWVFKNLPSLDDIPPALQETIFIKLFDISEVANFGPKERAAYQQSLKHLWDLNNVVDTAKKEGLEEGEAIGLEKGEVIGLEKGEAIGLEKGEAIGLEKGKAEGETIGIQLALKIIHLYSQGHAVAEIAKIVEKSIEFVEKVLRDAALVD